MNNCSNFGILYFAVLLIRRWPGSIGGWGVRWLGCSVAGVGPDKPESKKGMVQLIDAREMYSPMRKPLGQKRKEIMEKNGKAF